MKEILIFIGLKKFCTNCHLFFNICSILLLINGLSLHGQNVKFTNFKCGSNNIRTLAVEDNYIWVGTINGLYKRNITTNEIVKYLNENNGLISDYINTMIIDDQGNKWIGTYIGISKYDGRNWVSYDNTVGIYDNVIYSMAIDVNDELWFGSYGGLVHFDGETWTKHKVEGDFIYLDPFTQDSLYIGTLEIDSKNNKWVGTYEGLFKFDNNEWYQYKVSETFEENWITCLAIDSHNTIWFGTMAGQLGKYDGANMTMCDIEGSGDEGIISLCIDFEGNKWVTTNAGIYLYDDNNWTSVRSIPETQYASSIIDTDSNLWVSTADYLLKYDQSSWSEYTTQGLPNNGIYSLHIDREDQAWFGSLEEVTKFDGLSMSTYDFESIFQYDIRCLNAIASDSQNNPWIGAIMYGDIDAGVFTFDGESWTAFDANNSAFNLSFITDIEVDNNDRVWVAGGENSLFFYDNNSWDLVYAPSISITDLAFDQENKLWCGSERDGVGFYDGQNWTIYTTEDGLPSNEVHHIVIDDSNNVWGLTDHGLSFFDGSTWTNFIDESPALTTISTYNFDNNNLLWCGHDAQGISIYNGEGWTYYNTTDGLVDNQINAIHADSKNNVWIATPIGLSLATSADVILDLSKGWSAKGGGLVHQYKYEDRKNEVDEGKESKKGNIDYLVSQDSIPESLLIPLTVREFAKIKSFQFSIHFDPNVIEFDKLQNIQLFGIKESDFNLSQASEGIITVHYANSKVVSQSISDDSALFYILFNVVGKKGDKASVYINSDPVPMLIINKNGNELSYKTCSFDFILGSPVNTNHILSDHYFKIYPNPCNTYLHVDNVSNIVRMSVLDYTGRNMLEIQNLRGEKSVLINTERFQPGVYFIHCYNRDGSRSAKKVIITR